MSEFNATILPATLLTCVRLKVNGENPAGCGWYGKFYFDVMLPTICPRCGSSGKPNAGQRLKPESITPSAGYDHRAQRDKQLGI
jgi:hypothetical protein